MERINFDHSDENQVFTLSPSGRVKGKIVLKKTPDAFPHVADLSVEFFSIRHPARLPLMSLADDGTFHAHTLLAKCPSKYETAEDYAPADSPLESSVAH